jgi:hypothetical protein
MLFQLVGYGLHTTCHQIVTGLLNCLQVIGQVKYQLLLACPQLVIGVQSILTVIGSVGVIICSLTHCVVLLREFIQAIVQLLVTYANQL